MSDLIGRLVGARVQVRAGISEWPAVGTVTDADDLGIVLVLGDGAERWIPLTAITSIRRARA